MPNRLSTLNHQIIGVVDGPSEALIVTKENEIREKLNSFVDETIRVGRLDTSKSLTEHSVQVLNHIKGQCKEFLEKNSEFQGFQGAEAEDQDCMVHDKLRERYKVATQNARGQSYDRHSSN
ncbi:MAG: hypothetical protein M1819_007255 [Sarea resinae]|nr:MAG: hypothetical protein M1819_007255 [Sarea resinae]